MQRQQNVILGRPYLIKENKTLMKEAPDGIQRRCVAGPLTTAIIAKTHKGVLRRTFLRQSYPYTKF